VLRGKEGSAFTPALPNKSQNSHEIIKQPQSSATFSSLEWSAVINRWHITGLVAAVLSTTCVAEQLPSNPFNERSSNPSEASSWAPTLTRSPNIIPGTGEVIGSPSVPT